MEYGNGEKNQLVWRSSENRYHNENFHVDENNENVNVAMLAKVVKEGASVLDIGCGEGKLGIVLKRKKCKMVGVDLDEAACNNALKQGYYNAVFCFNIEQPEQMPEGYQEFEREALLFDNIALIDVLEHVINPTAVIKNVLPYLKDGGKILISIPNVNNGDIFLNLLRDRFNYREAGVLDNTHTKYFTKHSFVEWIQEINEVSEFSLDCEYLGSTFGYTDYLEQVKKELPRVYEFIQLNPYFNAIQHLFVLTYMESKDGQKTEHLNGLLDGTVVDLTKVLEESLDFSSVGQNVKVSMLPNERRILKERAESAEKGWANCAQELEKARGFEIKKQNDIDALKQSVEYLQKENDEITRKWKESAEALENAKAGWKESAEALENAKAGWKESAEALENAKAGWKECAEALKNAKAGWEECAEALKTAKVGWKECAEELALVNKGVNNGKDE